MAHGDHHWIIWHGQPRCANCAVFSDQADANCWRVVKTNAQRMAEALETVLADFTVGRDGTVYYQGETDGSKI